MFISKSKQEKLPQQIRLTTKFKLQTKGTHLTGLSNLLQILHFSIDVAIDLANLIMIFDSDVQVDVEVSFKIGVPSD